jgi:hypothetical protein
LLESCSTSSNRDVTRPMATRLAEGPVKSNEAYSNDYDYLEMSQSFGKVCIARPYPRT